MPDPQEKQDAPVDGGAAASMGAPPPEPEDDSELVFTSLDKFYNDYLSQVVWRRVDGVHLAWCPDWWRHPEAIARISTLWRAFEYLRYDGALGMSHWWLQHAAPHLAALMHPLTGPFALCSGPEGHTAKLGPLPGNPSPPEMWDHPAFSLPRRRQATASSPSGSPKPEQPTCPTCTASATASNSTATPVNAALTLPWSNGRTEGVNTRIRKIMRQMHGRAGFDLLRHRILLP